MLSGVRPRALLFDLDGTLVDSLPDIANAVDTTLVSRLLPPLGNDAIRSMVGNGSRTLIERALQATRWCGAPPLSRDIIEEVHGEFLRVYARQVAVRTRCYTGVESTLRALQGAGIQLAVVTNKPESLSLALIEELSLTPYFALLIGGDTLPEKKPSPLPLLHACRALGVSVADTLMIGDSRNDIDAARAAGMGVIAVSYGYNHGEDIHAAGADRVIDQFEALLALLAGDASEAKHCKPISEASGNCGNNDGENSEHFSAVRGAGAPAPRR